MIERYSIITPAEYAFAGEPVNTYKITKEHSFAYSLYTGELSRLKLAVKNLTYRAN